MSETEKDDKDQDDTEGHRKWEFVGDAGEEDTEGHRLWEFKGDAGEEENK